MTVELRRNDIGLLITLLTQEIDSVGEAKEKCAIGVPSYFYRLIDIRNRLLAMYVDDELPGGTSNQELVEMSRRV